MKIRVGYLMELVAMMGAGLAAARLAECRFGWDQMDRLQSITSLATDVVTVLTGFALGGCFFVLMEWLRNRSPPRWEIGRLTLLTIGAYFALGVAFDILAITIWDMFFDPYLRFGFMKSLSAAIAFRLRPDLRFAPFFAALAFVAWFSSSRSQDRPDAREINGRLTLVLLVVASLTAEFSWSIVFARNPLRGF